MRPIISQSILICYLILGLILPSKSAEWIKHPLHLSSTEVNYSVKSATLEISCRLFTDDMESALSKQFKTSIDLSSATKHKAMEELVKKYISMHFQVKVNGQVLALSYLGFEKDNEAIVVYLESVPVKGLKKMDITNTLMYDLFDDQSNIMHVTQHGNRKSSKLDYPNKILQLTF